MIICLCDQSKQCTLLKHTSNDSDMRRVKTTIISLVNEHNHFFFFDYAILLQHIMSPETKELL